MELLIKKEYPLHKPITKDAKVFIIDDPLSDNLKSHAEYYPHAAVESNAWCDPLTKETIKVKFFYENAEYKEYTSEQNMVRDDRLAILESNVNKLEDDNLKMLNEIQMIKGAYNHLLNNLKYPVPNTQFDSIIEL